MSFFESIFYMAWRGIAIGLIISAPMGPVGMLCIQRTLDKGRRAGFYTGIGAAISDLFYSLLTGFGLSFIEEFLERNQNIIQLVGSAVLIAFGVYLFRKNPSKGLKKPLDENISVQKSILGGFLFTFSNPLILFLTIGLFARFNFLLPEFHLWQYLTGFVFIFVGAILWWWFITFSVDKVRSHFNIRSMWLINKIIGVIILLFAVVGIFSAASALAKGADIRCWNESRGFGPFASGDGTTSRLSNETGDTIFFLAPCNEAEAVEFRCKVRNHKSKDRKKNWGFILKGNRGERIFLDIRTTETGYDGFSSSQALEVEGRCPDREPSKKSFADNTGLFKRIKSGMEGPDPSGSLNHFKISVYNDLLSLFGGLHSPEQLISMGLPENFLADSIGFYLAPGASISPGELRLTVSPPASFAGAATPEDIDEYLTSSRDPLEGYWQTLDRSLEESLLRMGGDYRYALLKNEGGYDLIYLSGATVNADKWLPGMTKATFRPSGIEGVWDVEWIDAMHQPLSHEIKAQLNLNGVITVQFPYQSSQIRLHPSQVTPRAGNDR